MSTYTWRRGLTTLSSVSGPDATSWGLITAVDAGSGLSVRRMVLSVDFQMTNTSGTWPPMPTVPAVFGVGTTSATGSDPVAPVSGPYTDPATANWWWDGLVWKLSYADTTGTSIFDAHKEIDSRTNHSFSTAENESLWAGVEVVDTDGAGGSYFVDWQVAVYWSLLFAPTLG